MEQGLGRRAEMNSEKVRRWRAKSRLTEGTFPPQAPKPPPQLVVLGVSKRISAAVVPHLNPVLRLPIPLMTTVSGSHSRRCSGARFLPQRVKPCRTRYPLTIVTIRLTVSSPTSHTILRSLHNAHHSTEIKQKTLPSPYQRIPSDVSLLWFFHPYLEKGYQRAGTT